MDIAFMLAILVVYLWVFRQDVKTRAGALRYKIFKKRYKVPEDPWQDFERTRRQHEDR